MAVLIERVWDNPDDRSGARVTTAILPSGKILTSDDENPGGAIRADLQTFIGLRKLNGADEDMLFSNIAAEFGSSYRRSFSVITDPNEAREIIKEAELTSTVTPRERRYYSDYDTSVGDGTQISNAEIRMKEYLEQSSGNRKEKA